MGLSTTSSNKTLVAGYLQNTVEEEHLFEVGYMEHCWNHKKKENTPLWKVGQSGLQLRQKVAKGEEDRLASAQLCRP